MKIGIVAVSYNIPTSIVERFKKYLLESIEGEHDVKVMFTIIVPISEPYIYGQAVSAVALQGSSTVSC